MAVVPSTFDPGVCFGMEPGTFLEFGLQQREHYPEQQSEPQTYKHNIHTN